MRTLPYVGRDRLRWCVKDKEVTLTSEIDPSSQEGGLFLFIFSMSNVVQEAGVVQERLTVGLPKSSEMLEKLRVLLGQVGFEIRSPSRTGSCGTVNNVSFSAYRGETILAGLRSGQLDAGLVTEEVLEEASLRDPALGEILGQTRTVLTCSLSRNGNGKTPRLVLAVPENFTAPIGRPLKIGSKFPLLAQKILEEQKPAGIDEYEIVEIFGDDETGLQFGDYDAVLCLEDSGESLEANGLRRYPGAECLRLVKTVFLAQPELSPDKECTLQELVLVLGMVLSARDQIMLKCNIPIKSVPPFEKEGGKGITIMELAKEGWCVIEFLLARKDLASMALRLVEAGATDIVPYEIIGCSSPQ